MKRYSKILLCAVLTTALSLFLIVPSSAVEGVYMFRPEQGASMYDTIEFTVTQYKSTDVSEGAWQGMSVSKTFNFLDGSVRFYEPNNNYIITFFPFAERWAYDEIVPGIEEPFMNGGYFECSIKIPFKSDNGALFDSMKLNENAYIKFMHIVASMDLHNINERAFSCAINLTDGGRVLLKQDSVNTISNGFYAIDVPCDIPCGQLDSFEYTFRYNGLSNSNNAFEFSMHTSSYIEVHDISKVQQGVIDSNNNAIGGVSGEVGELVDILDVSKPSDNDVNSALDSIDVGAVGAFGSLVGINSSSHVNFQRFILAISVSVLGVAFIGYVLHGKRG